MDPARRAAAAGIVRVHRGGWTNLTAKTALANPALSERDRAFAGALFYGTAERLATLDALLGPFLKKPPANMDVEVRAVLETGLYQMRYMRVPPRAAVNEAVELVRSFGKASAAGLVNAVLRRAADAELEALSFKTETERVCALYSVGPAVAEALMAALPEEYEAFLAASFAGDETCLRANTLCGGADALAAEFATAGIDTRPGQLPGSLYAKLPGGVARDARFLAGAYHVQGEASQYACACLGAQSGMKVLDLCAAPGGKSAAIAEEMGGGAGLIACDVRENRLPLIREAFRRLGITGAEVLLHDAAVYDGRFAGADRVLCDVPCSGLGVLAQNPDMRYTDGAHFAGLPAVQLAILQTAARYVKPGGRLVYATCTVRPAENAQVAKAFLDGTPGFVCRVPVAPPQGAVVCEEMVTILPHRTGLDGFFVATFDRV